MSKNLNELDEIPVIKSLEDIDNMKPDDVLDRYWHGTDAEKKLIDQMRIINRIETEKSKKIREEAETELYRLNENGKLDRI